MIDVTAVLLLDKDQARALGLYDAHKVVDECQMTGVAKAAILPYPRQRDSL
jgi:hypothetical protein